jgi:hypothetical protein
MDAVEDYARRWIKREVDQDPELESLSDWVRTIRSLVQGRKGEWEQSQVRGFLRYSSMLISNLTRFLLSSLCPFGFLSPIDLDYLAFQSFDVERT